MSKVDKKVSFKESSLPLTRKIQFKDQMKLNYSLFLKVGFFVLLFALPLIACVIGERMVLNYYSQDSITDKSGAVLYDLIFGSAKVLGFVFLAFGLSGLLRIYRRALWNEPVMFKLDFKDGIKKNSKRFLLIGLLIGLFFLIVNFALSITSITLKDNTLMFIAFILLLSLFIFVIFPMFIIMMFLSIYYENKLRHDFKNSFILLIKSYMPFIFISLLGFIPFCFIFIKNLAILLICLAIYFVIVFPMFLLISNLFLLSIFDKYINVNYKEYQYKGLHHEEVSYENE